MKSRRFVLLIFTITLAVAQACHLSLQHPPSTPPTTLEGSSLVLRVYDRCPTDPAAYRVVRATVTQNALMLSSKSIPESSQLVLTAEDQKSSGVAALLGEAIYTTPVRAITQQPGSTSTPGKLWIPLAIFKLDPAARIPSQIVRDSLGTPIANAQGSIVLWNIPLKFPDIYPSSPGPLIKLKKMISAADGTIILPRVFGEFGCARYRFSHPDYGTAEIAFPAFSYLPPVEFGNAGKTEFAKQLPPLSLVRRGSDAWQRAARGTVFDSAGKPLAGVLVTCEELSTPNSRMPRTSSFPKPQSVTDEQGRFTYYFTPGPLYSKRYPLTEIPKGTTYRLRLDGPPGQGFPPSAQRVDNQSESKFILRKGSHFRRFAFKSPGGLIDARDMFMLRIECIPDQQSTDGDASESVTLQYEDVAQGGFFLDGSYRAQVIVNGQGRMRPPGSFMLPDPQCYEAEITPNTPDVVQFKFSPIFY